MNPFYLNPAYKSSIFNHNVDVQTSLIPNRTAKENISQSQERVVWKPKHETSPFDQDAYYRQKRWDYKDRSLDDSRQGNSLDQSLVGKSFNEEKRQRCIRKGQEENRQIAIFKLQESISSKQPLGERKDFNKKELEIAIHRRNQHAQEQNNYRKELEKQIKEKYKSQKISELVDLSYSKSGLPIGEIHGGLDINHQIKMMRLKANKMVRSESQGSQTNRSLEVSREESCQVQNYSSNTYRGSSLSFYHDHRALAKSFIERVEEESDSHSQGSPKSFKRHAAGKSSNSQTDEKKKRKAKDPSESLLNPMNSKYMLKKQCHEKLREALKAQFRKYEEYTTKFLEDRQKRKQALMDGLDSQMARDQHRKKAVAYRDKELGKLHKEIDIGENISKESALQTKETALTKVSERWISLEKAAKKKPVRSQQERDGAYIRIVNDTINQLLNKRAKILEQVQKKGPSVERKSNSK